MSYFARSNELPQWAAHVPDGWGRKWLKWSVDLSTKRPTEAEQEALQYISNEDISSWTGKLLIEDPKPAEADSRRFQIDDVLFNKLRPYLAKVYHATFDGASSGELLCLRPCKAVAPRYYTGQTHVRLGGSKARLFHLIRVLTGYGAPATSPLFEARQGCCNGPLPSFPLPGH